MRRAFSILELLAATALAALMMLAFLHVIGSVGRTRAAMARRGGDEAWKADLLETLRRDLVNATGIRYDGGRVTLTGHAALDRATLAPGHEPVAVTYGVRSVGGRGWLFRRQAPRDGFSAGPAWEELVCPDVTGFSLRPATTLQAAALTAKGPDEPQPLPPAVVVEMQGPSGRVLEQTLVIR